MTVGLSLFLIAVGAILRYAVTWHPQDVNLDTVGLILILVGIVGLVISLAWMAQASRDRVVVRDRDVPPPPRV
jgi:Domain of unknown function (DUF6458)